MKITDIAIENRTGIVVLTLLLVIAGAAAYITIPKEANPSVEIPMYFITTIYPGIGPTDMESLVTQPLERELQGITGVDEIRSTTLEGVSTIVVEFDLGVPLIEASQRIRERVDMARPELPADAEDPIITELDIDDFPIMTINLAADYSLSRLTGVAERLEDLLESVSGVRQVDVLGGIEREVQVDVNLAALQGHNVSFNQIIGAIQRQNVTIPGGTVDVGRLNYLLRVSGEFTDPHQIEELVINPVPGGNPAGIIYMRDLADVIFGFEERNSYSRLTILQQADGQGSFRPVADTEVSENPVVSLNILARSGANVLHTAEGVREVLNNFAFPAGTQIVITGDQSENIHTLISDLENSIISGMIFVVLVLVFFLGTRNALLVGTAVPLSILVGFIILQVMGHTVNFVILFSLIIALGLLVDNSIVVVENIYRYMEKGHERFEAARLATNEVGYALLASTLTLIGAFAPMLFWPGIIGQFMGYLPMTLIIVLSCSLFVALVIYPVLTGLLVKTTGNTRQVKNSRIARRAGMTLLALTALIIGLINPITLAVTILSILVIGILYRLVIRPLSESFTQSTLPAIVKKYREFLTWMLARDYSVRGAMLRNTFSLASFTSGIILLIAGGLVSTLSQTAGLVLLIPGVAALALGVLGIIIHFVESVYLGGKISMKTGLIIALPVVFVYLLGQFRDGAMDTTTMLILLSLPGLIIIFGLLGYISHRERPLILTDNRARLLNTAFGSFFAIIALFYAAPTGVTFFPEGEPNRLFVNIEGPVGMNIDASNEMVMEIRERIDALLAAEPETKSNIDNILVNVGVSGDVFFGSGMPRAERSRIVIDMVDYADRTESSSRSLAKIRDQLQGIPDAMIQIRGEEPGPPTGPPVNIEISGEDFREIERIAREINSLLRDAAETGRIPGLVDIRDNISGGLPEYRILIDHEKAVRSGLNLAEIAQTVRIAMNGLEAGSFRDGEDEFDIVVRLRKEDRQDLESLENLTVSNMAGNQIPLVAVAEFVDGTGLGSITRLNMRRTATVEGQVSPGYSSNQVAGQVQTYLADYRRNLPAGYSMEFTGEQEEQDESFGFLTTALLIGFALIFLVMLVKFNSLTSPLIIMIAVGLSLIGVLAGLILTRTSFSLMTFIGIISLAGIVCINNIVLVDYIRQMLAKGLSRTEAIIEAGGIRFRPVVLTALTTILGLVPLTFGINIDFIGLFSDFDPDFQIGSENTLFWGPMGTAIISGLAFATFLTLVIVPVMYSVFDSLSRTLSR